jgi:hypothetical protein
MKIRCFVASSCLTLLTAAATFAQSSVVLRADIPFDFTVAGKTLPAGLYEVRPQIAANAPNLLSIQCLDCRTAGATIQTIGVQGKTTPENSKLVFNFYNNTYFLSSVWTSGYSRGRELFKSRSERELARNNPLAAPVEVVLARR